MVMYCSKCGATVNEDSLYCQYCGANLRENQPVAEDKTTTIGFALLGFFIPLAGLILFLIYEDKKPQRAKSAGKGALIGFITRTVLSAVFAVLYFIFAASLFSNLLNNLY